MATYNFTIRATDNLGAYADQNFSLTVNNTNIERFVIAGSTGLAHSSDGVTWTVESGQSGSRIAYGNGKWVVYGGAANVGSLGLNIRTSVDAFNWTTGPSGIPATQGSFNNLVITSLRYQNGLWTAFCATNNITSTSAWVEYTSPDLTTWTFKSYTTVAGTGQAIIYDHYVDPVSNFLVAVGFTGSGGDARLLYRTSAATALTAQVTGITNYVAGSLNYINGLYCVSAGSSSTVYTSIDGIGWTARNPNAATFPAGMTYANGRLIVRGTNNNTTALTTAYSLNGGRTWTAGPAINLSASLGGGNYGAAVTQGMAYYGGKLLILVGDTSGVANIYTSPDSGASYSLLSHTISNQIGVPYAIAARAP